MLPNRRELTDMAFEHYCSTDENLAEIVSMVFIRDLMEVLIVSV